MILNKKIPADFYKLFRTKNREAYTQFLIAIYEENNALYGTLGLTIEECRAIIEETIARLKIVWQDEEDEEDSKTDSLFPSDTSSGMLNRLIKWGWLKSDYDEKINTNVLTFPEFSQLYVELFQKLQNEDDSRERESILSIYSALFTYHTDKEKNNDILKSALHMSKSLGQLLSNMQDGMRTYFDELSGKKHFIGIQEVLIEELNNSDSKKYAILTTSDSFYRYKEAIKELISQILNENEIRKDECVRKISSLPEGSLERKSKEYRIRYCEDASQLIYQIEREFDIIERKYNRLIEQKSIFAKRALARIHYILQEGSHEEDSILQLVNLLDRSDKKDEILDDLKGKMKFTSQFHNITDSSFYSRKAYDTNAFTPIAVNKSTNTSEMELTDFVPKPLYTQKQLNDFRNRNTKNGRFLTTTDTVQSIEDLEQLLFIWQEETANSQDTDTVTLGKEVRNENGLTFTSLTIGE